MYRIKDITLFLQLESGRNYIIIFHEQRILVSHGLDRKSDLKIQRYGTHKAKIHVQA